MDAETGILPNASRAEVERDSAIRFLGAERELWRLLFRGSALLMVTLGIYRFWLVTDVRRFLWGNTEIAGDTLEYTGTPRELLIGFLMAIVFLIPVYLGLFIAALDLGWIGQTAAILAFTVLAALGHFAVFRARRYRLTRTLFRAVRLHQGGSALFYAFLALLWWTLNFATLGLTYPFSQASLERYKMRHTFYGDLRGRFTSSGASLFGRGFLIWLLTLGPLVVTTVGLIASLDASTLTVIGAALEGGENITERIESGAPGFFMAVGWSVASLGWGVFAALVLYPVFQAMILRWWISGLEFGAIRASSTLQTGSIYRVYLALVGWVLLLGVVGGIVGAIGIVIGYGILQLPIDPILSEAVLTIGSVGIYVVFALALSALYQVIVKMRMWKLGFESVQLTGLSELDRVRAVGAPSSPFGEGLADALDVGGY